jgi:hypothetical protein
VETKKRLIEERANKMEQISDFTIEACQDCGEFHRVAWYDVNEGECLLCDKCLCEYEFTEIE